MAPGSGPHRRWYRRRVSSVGLQLGLATMGVLLAGLGLASANTGQPATPAATPPATADLDLSAAAVRYLEDLDALVFELSVAAEAGATTPEPRGDLDGAPVLAYVVPTSLPAEAVGFTGEGIVALAVTAHPDFDDTPLWDESADGDYANDGAVWHAHWALLGPDDRVPGGLAVQAVAEGEAGTVLPPTNPGLPIYLDSPGFSVAFRTDTLRVVVPAGRVRGETGFSFDAVTAYLEVNTSDGARPLLGVYHVYEVLSGDLSLPGTVTPE